MTRRPALTLIETVLSLAILAGMGVAVLSVIGVAARTDTLARERQIATALADDLAGEIMAVPVTPPPPPSGTSYTLLGINLGGASLIPDTPALLSPDALDSAIDSLLGGSAPPNVGRLRFGRVSDYQGWSATPPQRRDGTPIPGLNASWRRTVYMQPIDPVSLNVTMTGTPRAYQVHVLVLRGERLLAHSAFIRSEAWDAVCLAEDQ